MDDKTPPGETCTGNIYSFLISLTVEQIIEQGFPKWMGPTAASYSWGAVAFWIRGKKFSWGHCYEVGENKLCRLQIDRRDAWEVQCYRLWRIRRRWWIQAPGMVKSPFISCFSRLIWRSAVWAFLMTVNLIQFSALVSSSSNYRSCGLLC